MFVIITFYQLISISLIENKHTKKKINDNLKILYIIIEEFLIINEIKEL